MPLEKLEVKLLIEKYQFRIYFSVSVWFVLKGTFRKLMHSVIVKIKIKL